jgi:hypothetical protein
MYACMHMQHAQKTHTHTQTHTYPRARALTHSLSLTHTHTHSLTHTHTLTQATYGEDELRRGGIVDVAGGKGEISFRLVHHHNIPCTLVDPRPVRLSLSPSLSLSLSPSLLCGRDATESLNAYAAEQSITPQSVRV